ncbi:MAG: hypothetical protein KY455_06835 [Euryarchaeota archaeon]|nr:hypothetical protein [Euryarchaeota archaeon]
MNHQVYKVDRSKAGQIPQVTQDEIVSRLSIVTKESEVLKVPGDCIYVLLEGNDTGLARAKELFEDQNIGRLVPPEVADQVRKAIKEEEESAAEGMGTLFG